MFRFLVLVCAFAAAVPAAVRATTFEPLTFNDLVAQADVIFVGDVVDVRPYTVQTRERTIVKTRVTFRVTDPLYGTSSIVEVFDFLGGETEGWRHEGRRDADVRGRRSPRRVRAARSKHQPDRRLHARADGSDARRQRRRSRADHRRRIGRSSLGRPAPTAVNQGLIEARRK